MRQQTKSMPLRAAMEPMNSDRPTGPVQPQFPPLQTEVGQEIDRWMEEHRRQDLVTLQQQILLVQQEQLQQLLLLQQQQKQMNGIQQQILEFLNMQPLLNREAQQEAEEHHYPSPLEPYSQSQSL